MSSERSQISDRELWRSMATDPVVRAAVSDLDIAAWLDGRLSEEQAARIEAAVGRDPELRRGALELADILGKPLPAAPSRLEVRARALVGFAAERGEEQRAGLFDWLFAHNRRFVLQRALALTVALVLAVAGFMLGGGLSESLARDRYAATSQSTDTSNELSDFLGSDGF